MKLPLKLFSNKDKNLLFLSRSRSILEEIIRYLSFGSFALFLYHLGYAPDEHSLEITSLIFTLILFILGLALISHILLMNSSLKSKRIIFELCLGIVLLVMALIRWEFVKTNVPEDILIISKKYLLVNIAVIIVFLMELSKLSLMINKLKLSPSLIFILSFLVLILMGTALLSLPKASVNGISLVDALFTSTSAVCVTGLIVLDTSTEFTVFGQIIIMCLFQIGGLGMMTFTSFFGFFFKGSLSIENSLFLRDYINENNISEISSTLVKIILFTLGVELIAAVLIYHYSDLSLFASGADRAFFAAFHAISAFCNAGFSTLSNGLYQEGFRELYSMHLTVAFTIILGGIGFPVFINYYNYIKHALSGKTRELIGLERYRHTPRVSNLNTRLVIYTTGILLVIGFLSYWVFEEHHTLNGLSGYGKFVTAFFGSVTPRTAGFNTVDMGSMALPTVLIYLLLMWIGASPGSTGGGIKTSTFAVAIINTWSIATGRVRVEVFRREISSDTLRKAFAVISLSFLVIGLGVFLIMAFNPELALIDVAFEVFSAFATVGLSLGITANLSVASKVVIIIIMFLGRVGTLTILVAAARRIGEQNYKYPEETVYIT